MAKRVKMGKDFVKQTDLQAIVGLRQIEAEVEAKLKAVQKDLSARESAVMRALTAGSSVEPGALKAAVETTWKRIVKWKEKFVLYLGEKKATEILEATSPTEYKSLVIQ